MSRRCVSLRVVCAASLCLLARPLSAQPLRAAHATNALRDLNNSVEDLVRRVSPAVVQILATGYGRREGADSDSSLDIVRQRSVGSGVVIDAAGYIVTNAHVVAGAVRLQVVVAVPDPDETPVRSLSSLRTKTFEARVVGAANDIDLAVLKIDATNLLPVPIADYDKLRKGDLVFAIGSPGGLRDSVSMGIVSAVARQLEPDSPLVYVQTDAPISPGSSGGALVNVDGELVGINALIMSRTGGNEGLGFAIPSSVVAAAYQKLRTSGRLERDDIGLYVQTVTPALARGLGLGRDWGVVVVDILDGGPADAAGVRVQDIVTSVDGKPTTSVPLLAMQLGTHHRPDRVTLGVLRGSDELAIDVAIVQSALDVGGSSGARHLDIKPIEKLGILTVKIDDTMWLPIPGLRIRSGLVVVARPDNWAGPDCPVAVGDVIHAVNGTAVHDVESVESIVSALERGHPIVLQIERDGQLMFVAFERD